MLLEDWDWDKETTYFCLDMAKNSLVGDDSYVFYMNNDIGKLFLFKKKGHWTLIILNRSKISLYLPSFVFMKTKFPQLGFLKPREFFSKFSFFSTFKSNLFIKSPH